MELVSNCSNPQGVEAPKSGMWIIRRVFTHAFSIGLMVVGVGTMAVFGGRSAYVGQNFQEESMVILGFALICMFSGGRIAVSLSPGDARLADMRVLKRLCFIGITLGVLMIAIGAWNMFVS